MAFQYRYRINPSTDDIIAKPSNQILLSRKKQMTDAGGWYYENSISDVIINSRNSKEAYAYLRDLITTEIADETGACGDHVFVIEMLQNHGWVAKFTGTFTIRDIDTDLDLCALTLKITESSLVKCFEKHLDEEFNILSLPDSYTSYQLPNDTIATLGYEWTFETSDGSTTEPHPGTPAGVYWIMDTEFFESYASGVDYTLYLWYFQFEVTNCIGGVAVPPDDTGTWFNFTLQQTGEDCTPDGTTEWRKIFSTDPLAAGLTSINLEFSAESTSEIAANSITSGLVSGPPNNYSAIINWGSVGVTEIPNGRTLFSVFTHFVTRCELLGSPDNQFWIKEGVSYVTGEENVYHQMRIHQITDVKYPTADTPASRAIITAKKFFADINKMFDVWWRIGEDGVFTWEHRSWFFDLGYTPTDLTTTTGFRKFKWLKDTQDGIKNFVSRAQSKTDFVGKPITYTQPCVSSESETINLELFSTDIGYIQQFPDKTPDDCLVLLAVNSSEIITLVDGKLTNTPVANAPLSWANLHHYFHRHNAYTKGGTVNGVSGFGEEPTFIRTVPLREARLVVKDCGLGLDPYAPIKTNLTEALGIDSGEIEDMKINLAKHTAEITYTF